MNQPGWRLTAGALVVLAAVAGSAGAQAAFSTYTNAEYHFTFQYPSRLKPDFSFTTDRSWTFLDPANDSGKSMGFETFGADNSAEGGGTSLPFFGISQEVRVGITPDIEHCYTPGNATLPDVGAATINGVEFKVLRADVSAFSAMHTRQDATSYRTVHDGACVAVESVVEESHDAGSGNSGETPQVAAAAAAAASEAEAIIHTFRFTDLPAAGASAAGAVPTAAKRVTFAAGATQGAVTGRVDAGAAVSWLIGAAADQPLMLDVDSTNHDLTLSVMGQKRHAPLFNTLTTASPWRAIIPDTGDYLIQVHGGAASEDYRLEITTPARIAAPSESMSVQRRGRTAGGLPVDFVLHVLGGQTLVVALHADGGPAALRAYAIGGDGTRYVNAADHQASARFTVWHDEDCVIGVVPADGAELPFTLDITIPRGRG